MKLSILLVFGVFTVFCEGQQRIAGGELTTTAAFPFAAALLTRPGSGAFAHACGGTIISRSAVLSAAACFFTGETVNTPAWWRARIGSKLRHGGGIIHIVNRIATHPDFSRTTMDSNIAVLRTRFDMDFIPGVVGQAFIPGTAYVIEGNRHVQAIGWGADRSGVWSEQLRAANIFTVDQQTCVNRYNEVSVTVTQNMMCAGVLDVGVRGQCEGDEGSPLLDDATVVGVYSHNRGCADFYHPAINTRVPPFARWIVANSVS